MLIVATGRVMMRHLHLSASIQSAAPTVFLGVAVAFSVGRLVVFANAVLAGFQRFGTINAIFIGSLILRFSGFAFLLWRHRSLAEIAIWYAAVALIECLVALGIAHRLGALRADPSLLEWRRLSRVVGFGFSSLLTTELFNLLGFGPPVLASILTGGSRATMALYAGQRPCFIISEFNWRGAEVLFSASAAQKKREGNGGVFGSDGFRNAHLLAVAMPLCIGLFILAPVLVSVWLQNAGPQVVTVMRLTSIGIIADAVWVGPLHVLWGRGLANRVLLVTACVAAMALFLNCLLIPRFGAPGSAMAFAASAWIGAIITVVAAMETSSSWLKFLVSSFSDLAIPSASLALTVLAASSLLRQYPRLLLLAATIGGGLVYALAFWTQQRFRKRSVNSLFW